MKKVSIRFRHEFPADRRLRQVVKIRQKFQFALDTNFLPTFPAVFSEQQAKFQFALDTNFLPTQNLMEGP